MCESEECSQSLHVMNTISPTAHCFGALQFLQEIPAFERPAGNALQCRGLHAQDPCWMGLTRACSHILEKKGEFYEISSWVEIWHWIGVGLHMAWKSVYGCFVWQYCAWLGYVPGDVWVGWHWIGWRPGGCVGVWCPLYLTHPLPAAVPPCWEAAQAGEAPPHSFHNHHLFVFEFGFPGSESVRAR